MFLFLKINLTKLEIISYNIIYLNLLRFFIRFLKVFSTLQKIYYVDFLRLFLHNLFFIAYGFQTIIST